MNSFDDYYDIRLAQKSDIDTIMEFINSYWKKGHILGTNKPFFEYEMTMNDEVHFIVAFSKQTGALEGIQGYIPSSMNPQKKDLWAVVWKVLDSSIPMLGSELKKRLLSLAGGRFELGVGANPQTAVPILRFLGYEVQRMHHYYLLNPNSERKVSKIINYSFSSVNHYDISVKRVFDIDQLNKCFDYDSIEEKIPFKDAWYIKHRFFDHPIYSYNVFLAQYKSKSLIIIAREQLYCGVKVLRLVDFIGNESIIEKLGDFFQGIVMDYEYIDVYFAGIPVDLFSGAGFVERKPDDDNIIPNYFEPYIQENVDIWVDSNVKGCTFFKADGDQDRPNSLFS